MQLFVFRFQWMGLSKLYIQISGLQKDPYTEKYYDCSKAYRLFRPGMFGFGRGCVLQQKFEHCLCTICKSVQNIGCSLSEYHHKYTIARQHFVVLVILICTFISLQDGDKPDPDIIQYELLATVTHCRDLKTGGNLVSHIKALETYHQRKERVTCVQWYLFNDFSITPIEPVCSCFSN